MKKKLNRITLKTFAGILALLILLISLPLTTFAQYPSDGGTDLHLFDGFTKGNYTYSPLDIEGPLEGESEPSLDDYFVLKKYYDNPDLIEEYTKTDALINTYETRVQVYYEEHGDFGMQYDIDRCVPYCPNQDDPIVEIVPKELCFIPGYHLYFGQEYGFYIKVYPCYPKNYMVYVVDVMVFDINIKVPTFWAGTSDVRGFGEVVPLYEYRFNTEIYEFGDWKYIYPHYCLGLENIWNPDVVRPENDYVYLSDFQFNFHITNLDYYNPIDVGLYNAEEDYGPFIIQTRTKGDASWVEQNKWECYAKIFEDLEENKEYIISMFEESPEEAIEFIVNTLEPLANILGLDASDVISIAIAIVDQCCGTYFGWAQIICDILLSKISKIDALFTRELGAQHFDNVYDENNNVDPDKKALVVDYWHDPNEQILKYGELVRDVNVEFPQTTIDNYILEFINKQTAKVEFLIDKRDSTAANMEAINNSKKKFCLTSSISFKITDKSVANKEFEMTRTYVDCNTSSVSEQVSENDAVQINLQEGEIRYYSFIPEESGQYDFCFEYDRLDNPIFYFLGEDCRVSSSLEGKQGLGWRLFKASHYLEKDKKYFFAVQYNPDSTYSTNSGQFRVIRSISENDIIKLNEKLPVQLNNVNDYSVFQFKANHNGIYAVQVTGETNGNPTISLLSEYGELLSETAASSLVYDLEKGKTYYIKVSNTTNVPNLQCNIQLGYDYQNAETLYADNCTIYEGDTNVSLTYGGFRLFKFRAKGGNEYALIPNEEFANQEFAVFDANGTYNNGNAYDGIYERCIKYGINKKSITSIRYATDTTIYILAYSYLGTATNYSFSIKNLTTDEPYEPEIDYYYESAIIYNNPPLSDPNPETITLHENTLLDLNGIGQTEGWLVFNPTKSGNYDIYTDNLNDDGGVDPILTLYSDAWEILAYNDNDDDLGYNNAKITYYLEAGETYYIKASDYGDNGPDYFVKAQIHTVELPEDTLFYVGSTDQKVGWLVFHPSKSGIYDIYTDNQNEDGGTDPILTLYSADWEELDYNDDDDDLGYNNAKITYYLEAGETYYIKASDYGDNGPDYFVKATHQPVRYTSGMFYIKNLTTGKYLTVNSGVDKDYTSVGVSTFTGSVAQRWRIVYNNGVYNFYSACSTNNRALDVTVTTGNSDLDIHKYYSGYNCYKYTVEGDMAYGCVIKNGTKYLSIQQSGENWQSIKVNNDSSTDIWVFEFVGEEDITYTSGTYYIKNTSTGKYLTVNGGGDYNYNPVGVNQYTGSTAQRWRVVYNNGVYNFYPECSATRALDVTIGNGYGDLDIHTYHAGYSCYMYTVSGDMATGCVIKNGSKYFSIRGSGSNWQYININDNPSTDNWIFIPVD